MCTIYLRNKKPYILPTQSGKLFKWKRLKSLWVNFLFCVLLWFNGYCFFFVGFLFSRWLSPGFNIRPVGQEVGSRYLKSTLQYRHLVQMYSTTECDQIWYWLCYTSWCRPTPPTSPSPGIPTVDGRLSTNGRRRLLPWRSLSTLML